DVPQVRRPDLRRSAAPRRRPAYLPACSDRLGGVGSVARPVRPAFRLAARAVGVRGRTPGHRPAPLQRPAALRPRSQPVNPRNHPRVGGRRRGFPPAPASVSSLLKVRRGALTATLLWRPRTWLRAESGATAKACHPPLLLRDGALTAPELTRMPWNTQLAPLDTAIVVVYILGTTLLGAWF